jgi:hypothetical protein
MDEIVNQLNEILEGRMKANSACDEAQRWLQITCYMYAKEIAKKPTKKDRAQALEMVKQEQPLFYDDVEQLAKQIWKANYA